MKRKVMLQFMVAMLIIGLMVSFINTTVVSYFMYVTSEPMVASKLLANFSPDTFNIKQLQDVRFVAGQPELSREVIDKLKKSGSFIQIVDGTGKEIESINKPDFIKMTYLPEEMAKLIGSPEMVQYKLQANPIAGEKTVPFREAAVSSKVDILGGKTEVGAAVNEKKADSRDSKTDAKAAFDSDDAKPVMDALGKNIVIDAVEQKADANEPKRRIIFQSVEIQGADGRIAGESTVNYDLFIQVPNGDPNSSIRMIIGIMRPKINMSMFLYSFLRFFTEWDKEKLFSTFLTVLVCLVMGYLFASRMARPVVKITNGISEIAAGSYEASYPEKGLYSEVYASLNHMGSVLRQNEEERKRLEKMRADWITNISHDLKTPLASIKGYGEMLLEPDYNLTPEERKKYSEVIFNKSNYIERLIDDLKLVQKLRNNMLPLKKADGNIVDLVREIVISILNDPQYENRMISYDASPELIALSYDTGLLQRAFTNLVYNAVLHNPADTQISVSVSMLQSEKGICAAVEIRDNGRGIPEEDQKKLFERYYRGTSTDSLQEGSGLGLTIAREVIEAHGGRIELRSEVGKGTSILVFLPGVLQESTDRLPS